MCAPSDDDWTSLGLSLYSFIVLTGLASIDLGLERIIHFSGFLVVCFLVFSRTSYTDRTFSIHIGDTTTIFGFLILIFDQEPCSAFGEKLAAFFVLRSVAAATISLCRSSMTLT